MRHFFMGTLTLLVVSCGDVGKKSDDKAPVNSGVLADLGMTGTWINACRNPEGGGSSQDRLEVRPDGTALRLSYFQQADCRAGDETVVYDNVYDSATKIDPSDLEGYATVRQQLRSYTATLLVPDRVESFNTQSRYGFTDWAQGQPKDVSGRKFEETDATATPKIGALRYYTLALVDGKLRFAIYPDGKTAAASTDPQDVFTKL